MASETREDIVRTLEAIIANDRTTYRHGQKRPDGKKPSQAEKPGSIWLTPKEMASTLIAKLKLDTLKESQAPSPGVTSEQEQCDDCGQLISNEHRCPDEIPDDESWEGGFAENY